MSSITLDAPAPAARPSLYRAIWRWHFFAGLLVIPFLITLSVTGGLYLFKDEIDRTVFAYRTIVSPGEAQLPPSGLVLRAVGAVPGSTETAYREPGDATHSALVKVAKDGATTLVYLDPYTGTVLDAVPADREFHWVVKKLHSLDYFGSWTNRLVEAVGGFAIVLVVTGFYLWWPRGRSGGVVTIRRPARRRVFWRDLHAVTGAFAGLLILFLAVSGMPWSGFWGTQLNTIIASAGLGYPAALWDNVPTSGEHAGHVMDTVAWTVEDAPMPMSGATAAAPIGVDRAVAIARKAGISPGFELTLPAGETGVYTAAIYPDDLARQRTIHIDQYSGEPLVDLRFADYGGAAKAIEFGINVHQGQEWGLANQLVMLATCLAIILASISAVVMWWKRRPAGRVGVPPLPADRSVYAWLWGIAIVVGVIFPLTGIAIVAMVLADRLVVQAVAPLRRAFS